MKLHEEILAAARRLCVTRQRWTFTPAEVVQALPHLNPRSVRTHVVSRCCANAPSHHAHRWPYFERLQRGVYEIRKEYRAFHARTPGTHVPWPEVAEADSTRDAGAAAGRPAIHAFAIESDEQYVAECLEVAVVTQGASPDEVLGNLREALALYQRNEDPALLGPSSEMRLVVTFETWTRPP